MAEVTINYKDAAIATMDASGTKTLQTQGKYCEDDIEVVYSRPSAPSGAVQSGSFTPEEDITAFSVELSAPATHFLFYNADYPTNGLNVGFWTFAGWWFNNTALSFQIYNEGTANFARSQNASVTLTDNTLTFNIGSPYKMRHEKTYIWFAW